MDTIYNYGGGGGIELIDWMEPERNSMKSNNRGRAGMREQGKRACACVLPAEFLTVHWKEIIREWVKLRLTPRG